MALEQDPESAVDALRSALELEAAGRFAEAFERFRRTTELDFHCGLAWRHLGDLLRRSGDLGSACECFERAIASGDDPSLNGFFLSAIGIGAVVPAPPASFVSALFDQYAARFDVHLHELNYRAPRMLSEMVARCAPRPYFTVLDLGCGTGLAAAPFAATSRRITGVDLSGAMLERAERLGIYDRLVQSDIEGHVRTTPETCALVLACDVFIYLGDLSGVFAGIHRVLCPSGRFAFTVESGASDMGYDLLPHLRYAHSERYIRQLAAALQFTVLDVTRGALRDEAHQAVEGLAVLLERAGPWPDPGTPR